MSARSTSPSTAAAAIKAASMTMGRKFGQFAPERNALASLSTSGRVSQTPTNGRSPWAARSRVEAMVHRGAAKKINDSARGSTSSCRVSFRKVDKNA